MNNGCKLCGMSPVYSVPPRISPNDATPFGELCEECLEAAAVTLAALRVKYPKREQRIT